MITERSNLDIDNVPGDAQLDVLTTIGPVFVETGDVLEQSQDDDALDTIINDTFATKADPTVVE